MYTKSSASVIGILFSSGFILEQDGLHDSKHKKYRSPHCRWESRAVDIQHSESQARATKVEAVIRHLCPRRHSARLLCGKLAVLRLTEATGEKRRTDINNTQLYVKGTG